MLINIRANWQNAKKGMNSVLGHAKGLGNGITGAFDKVKGALGSIAGMFGMGIGIAATVNQAKKLIDKMDEIEDNAPKIGVSFAYFQKMQFAAERTGTSFGAVTSGFTRVKKLASEAAAGLRSGTDAFAMLGMGIGQISALNPEQLFDEVTKRINAIEDPLLRDSAATQIFGKNFTELNNYLKDHIALGDELQARGSIIGDDQILAASALKDHISNISFSLQSWAVNSGFIQQLAAVTEGLDAIFSNSKKMEKAGIKTGTEEYDANEGGLKKTARRLLNAASFSGLSHIMGKDQMKLGDKLFGRPEEKLQTAAIDRDEIRRRMGTHEEDAERKRQVNEAAKKEAEIGRAVTKAARDAEAAKLNATKAGVKDAEEMKLKAAQAAMTGKGTGTIGNAASASAKETVDNLRRVGGYTGGAGMQTDRTAMLAKKQVDLLGSVDQKLAVLENAARTGGMIFP